MVQHSTQILLQLILGQMLKKVSTVPTGLDLCCLQLTLLIFKGCVFGHTLSRNDFFFSSGPNDGVGGSLVNRLLLVL